MGGGIVDAVLTFAELEELFEDAHMDPATAAPADFRPPRANLGRIYPVTGGLLKAAAIDADILESPVYVVEGAERVMDILRVLSQRVKNGLPVLTACSTSCSVKAASADR